MKLPQAVTGLSPGPRNKKEAFALYLKGVLMGIADLIPGVSGGTIAFITGIYQQLIDAISSVNQEVLKDLLRERVFMRLEEFIGSFRSSSWRCIYLCNRFCSLATILWSIIG